jgi:hypothetical protein
MTMYDAARKAIKMGRPNSFRAHIKLLCALDAGWEARGFCDFPATFSLVLTQSFSFS